MTEQLTVSVDDLRTLVASLLEHLSSVQGTEVHLDTDFFWAISAEQLYDVYKEPHDLTIGQLSESWTNLTGILAGDSPLISYALVWLADVLRAIGHDVVR